MKTETTVETRENVQKALGLAIALGVLIMILGAVAIANPLIAALTATLIVGWLFTLGGIFRIIYAIQSRGHGNLFLKILIGILYLVAGISLIRSPMSGSVAIALLVGLAILFKGIFQVIWAFQVKPNPSWGWVLISGIVGIVLGILIWNQGAVASVVFLGLLFGLDLLFDGLSVILLALTGRRALKNSDVSL